MSTNVTEPDVIQIFNSIGSDDGEDDTGSDIGFYDTPRMNPKPMPINAPRTLPITLLMII